MSIDGSFHGVLPSDAPVPGWRVVSLIDPVGAGQDLAFTQGLVAFQLPELLLWGRPTEGLDPGADWLLSHRERSRLLSAWAGELVTGRLGSGAEREERFDGGGTVARFRFGRPVSAASLHHPHLSAQTRVLSISWSLVRQANGRPDRQPRALSPAVQRRMEGWISNAEATMTAWQSRLDAPPVDARHGRAEGRADGWAGGWADGWAGGRDEGGPTGALSIAVPGRNRFGPMTAWVDARIAQLLAADAQAIGSFLRRLEVAGLVRCDDCLLEQLTDLAVRTGRTAACREVSLAAQEVSLTVVGRPGQPTTVWQRAVGAALGPAVLLPSAGVEQTVTLTDGVEVLLTIAVLADVAPSSMTAAATGPWEWAVAQERLPGRHWLAPSPIRAATKAMLAGAGAAQIVAAVERSRVPFGLGERHTLNRLLHGLQTTRGGSAHQGTLFRRDQRRGLPRTIVRACDVLAGQLLTAMAMPERLPPGGWDLVRDTVFPLAPELPPVPPDHLGC